MDGPIDTAQLKEEMSQTHKANIDYLASENFASSFFDQRVFDRIIRYKDNMPFLTFNKKSGSAGQVYIKLYGDGKVSAEVTLSNDDDYGSHAKIDVPKSMDAEVEVTNDRLRTMNKSLVDKLNKHVSSDVVIQQDYYQLEETPIEMGVYDHTSAKEAYETILKETESLQKGLK